jgi:SAM-dependent methyltransferase
MERMSAPPRDAIERGEHGDAEPDFGDPERIRRARFEGMYRAHPEVWSYSRRGAELLRHDYVVRIARTLHPFAKRMLDIGCSAGQLTSRLAGAAPDVYAIDISETAIERARVRCEAAALGVALLKAKRGRIKEAGLPARTPATRVAEATSFHFSQASSYALPFSSSGFDVVLCCDGIHSWRLDPDETARTLSEANRLLAPGGHVIVTDHMRPEHFDTLIDRVQASPLRVESIRFLHNRLWYSLERTLRRHERHGWAQWMLASRGVARGLGAVASLAGRRGAKHVCIVATKG